MALYSAMAARISSSCSLDSEEEGGFEEEELVGFDEELSEGLLEEESPEVDGFEEVPLEDAGLDEDVWGFEEDGELLALSSALEPD